MKTYIAIAALVAAAQAQDLSTLPACIQNCVANMLGIAGQLGCSATDIPCLCNNANFGHGVVDCSSQSCPSGTDINAAVTYLSGYCANAAGGNSASASASSFAATSAASSGASAAGGTAGGASSVPISTEGVYTTITTDGSTLTSLVSGTSTLFGVITTGTDSAGSAFTSTITDLSSLASSEASGAAASGSSAASDASASASSVAASASSAASGVESSASAAASSAGAGASSAASSAASGASSSASSAAGAPIVTMAANGVVGLAGLAAVMLL